MELRAALAALRRWWWPVLSAAAVAGALAFAVGHGRAALYEAQATLLVQQAPMVGGPTYSDVLAGQQLAQTYSRLVTTAPVLEEAAAALGLAPGEVAAMVRARGRRDTQLVEVTARAPDPALAARVADEVAQTFIQRVRAAQTERQAAAAASLTTRIAAVQRGIEDKQQQVARLSGRSPTLPEDQRLEQLAQARADLDALRQNLAELQRRQQDLQLDPTGGAGVTLVAPARPPAVPVGPSLAYRTLLGGATGLALALVAVALGEYLDDRVRTGEAMARFTRLPLLGEVPRLPRRRRLLGWAARPAETAAPAPFRTLLAALALPPTDGGAAGTLLITSAGAGEGRSTVAAGLARAASAAGRNVLLVDADLQRPTLHRQFGLPNQEGLTTLLATPGRAVASLARPVGERLRVLTAGPSAAPQPPERLAAVLAELAHMADLVLVDGPPLADGDVAPMLAGQVDGVVLVGAAGRTRGPELAAAAGLLALAGARVRGAVLNHR
jgi:Mrp family chromosome partitioning ATPase